MTTGSGQLPKWNLASIFPGLDSPEFVTVSAAFAAGIDELEALFERYEIASTGSIPLNKTPAGAFEDVTDTYNQLLAAAWRLEAYCYAEVAVDAGNAIAQHRWSEYARLAARLEWLRSRYSAWLVTLDLDTLIARSSVAASHAGTLRTLAEFARHQMSPPEESLAADLHESGAGSWSGLYERIWSNLTIEVELDSERQVLPMSRARHLAAHPDRETRQRSYEAELQSWQSVSLPLAAALNGVKGQAL